MRTTWRSIVVTQSPFEVIPSAFPPTPKDSALSAETINRSKWICRGWVVALLCLLPAGCYYLLLIVQPSPGAATSGLFGPVSHGLTFNSMLLHLLRGAFDVDPQTIGDEGIIHNGSTYAYFGILPALFRLFVLPTTNFPITDFSRLSCLTATLIMTLFKLLSVLTVWRAARTRQGPLLITLFIVTVLFGGPQIQFLRPSIYQEVIQWSGAFAAGFVYFILRGCYSQQGFTIGILATLALMAGLALLTRVSTALGLYIAFGLICIQLAWRQISLAGGSRKPTAHGTHLVSLLIPVLILTGFATLTGLVNYERWGNPLNFGDVHSHIMSLTVYPDRLARLNKYGPFNLARLGYGIMYYFFPVWVIRDGTGNFFGSALQQRILDGIELPPSSFFISDPLLVGLMAYAFLHFLRPGDMPKPNLVIPPLIGLAIPPFLMLTFLGMTFRYRMEFYPFLELAAFIGFDRMLAKPTRRRQLPFVVAAIAGIVASHVLWVLYMTSPFGTVTEVVGSMSVTGFYSSLFH
jgi:hypothetical protein